MGGRLEFPIGGANRCVIRENESAERAGGEVIVLKVFAQLSQMGVLVGLQPIEGRF